MCANLLLPFITKYPRRIFEGGLGLPVPDDFSACKFDASRKYSTSEIEPILNRLDVKKELAGRHVIDHKVKQERATRDLREVSQTAENEVPLVVL